MNGKKVFLFSITLLTIFTKPVFARAYENISIIKLIFQLIFYLIVFIIVIFITLYGTKFIAKRTKENSGSKYTNLLDVTNIPGGSKIVIVEINNIIYVLSTNNNGTNLIDKIKKEEFPIVEEDFNTYLDKYLVENKLDYENVKIKIKSFFNKSKTIKGKEEKKDEKKS